MSLQLLLQAGSPNWYSSGWLWFFIACLIIVAFGLLRYTWWSPRGPRR